MKAFHNDASIKEKYLKRLYDHKNADEIVKGTYWENGKGCAVGCTIHGNYHKDYEKELGIPEWVARVEDRIFEGLENSLAKEFPIKFLESINVGANLELIKIPFLIFILESNLNKFNHEKFPKVKESIEDILFLLKNRNINKKDSYNSISDAVHVASDAKSFSHSSECYIDCDERYAALYASSATVYFACSSGSYDFSDEDDVACGVEFFANAAYYSAASAAAANAVTIESVCSYLSTKSSDSSYLSASNAALSSAYAAYASSYNGVDYGSDYNYSDNVSYADSSYYYSVSSGLDSRYETYEILSNKFIELIKSIEGDK